MAYITKSTNPREKNWKSCSMTKSYADAKLTLKIHNWQMYLFSIPAADTFHLVTYIFTTNTQR